MNNKNESTFYSKIKQLLAVFSYHSDLGINFELTDLLPDIAHAKKTTFRIDENDHYQITVEIENFSMQSAREAFVDLLHFIEYSGATFYTRQMSEDCIKYLLASLTQDGVGFMMEIEFIPQRKI